MQGNATYTLDAAKRCRCTPHVERRRLVIDATDCPDSGRLSSEACRETVVATLVGRPVVSVRTRTAYGEYVHDDGTVGMLVAAGRFADCVRDHDRTLAARACRDPLAAAREAVGRGDYVGRLAAETGLAEGVWHITEGEFPESLARELNPLTSAQPTRSMLHDVEAADELAPEELRTRYDDRLRAVLEEYGVETVAEKTALTHETISGLEERESPDLTLEEAAALLAVSEDEPDAEAIVIETRDHLLMGMTTAVLDVEAVESGIEGALDAREIQQKIEGRLPMTLDELAMIQGYIESRQP